MPALPSLALACLTLYRRIVKLEAELRDMGKEIDIEMLAKCKLQRLVDNLQERESAHGRAIAEMRICVLAAQRICDDDVSRSSTLAANDHRHPERTVRVGRATWLHLQAVISSNSKIYVPNILCMHLNRSVCMGLFMA